MSSKDLDAVEFLPELLDIGIDSLKIEGRMKSIHYIATVVLAYRMLIDDYQNGCLKDMSYYQNEIKKAENRLTSHGFLAGETTTEQQLYNSRSEMPTQEFIALVKGYDKQRGLAKIEQRNYFEVGDKIEVVSPKKTFHTTIVESMYDEDMQPIDVARHPLQILYIPIDFDVEVYDLIRRIS
jgi:putative protease